MLLIFFTLPSRLLRLRKPRCLDRTLKYSLIRRNSGRFWQDQGCFERSPNFITSNMLQFASPRLFTFNRELLACLRMDRIHRSLGTPYVGPLLLVKTAKFFKVEYPLGVQETLSYWSLKPTFLPQPASLDKVEVDPVRQPASPSTESDST